MTESNKENPEIHRHSKIITGYRTQDDALHWHYQTKNIHPYEDENIEIRFFILVRDTPTPQKNLVVKKLLKQMETTTVPWLVAGRSAWAFDLDQMKEEFKGLKELAWCKGRVLLEPEFEVIREGFDIGQNKYYETSVVFYLDPEALGMRTVHRTTPPEIEQSLKNFQLDHPDPRKVAFIMMKFGDTPAHEKIVQGIKEALTPYGISGVRADEKDYHTDLYPNVLTYIYGCGFGIAVFERIEKDDFNPNVSLEVGYIKALGKYVCLLKDKTLPNLQTDLVGTLYKPFDPQDPVSSIPPVLIKWMKDWRII